MMGSRNGRRSVSVAACVWLGLAGTSCAGPEAPAPDACAVTLGSRCWARYGLDGDSVTCLAVTDWGAYAGTRRHGLFRLESAAASWRSVGFLRQTVTSILFDPTSPPQLLVSVAPHGSDTVSAVVYASVDGGASWLPRDGGIAASQGYQAMAQSLARDPTNPSRLFMGLSYPVLRSLDAGSTWQYVFGGPEIFGAGIYTIGIPVSRTSRVWAAGESGVQRAVVLRSDDGGDTWTVLSPPQWVGNIVTRILADSLNPDVAWVGMGGGVQWSSDAGATWKPVLTIGRPSVVWGLVETGGAIWAASTEESFLPSGQPVNHLGLYRSIDGGASWDTIATPANADGATDLTVDQSGRLIIGTLLGVWRVSP